MEVLAGIAIIGAIAFYFAAMRGNTGLYMGDPLGSVQLGEAMNNARISTGIVTNSNSGKKQRGLFVYASKYYVNRPLELMGTYALTEQQIQKTTAALRSRSESVVAWGPRKKVSVQLAENGSRLIVSFRRIGLLKTKFALPLEETQLAALLRAFERLENAQASTIIEA